MLRLLVATRNQGKANEFSAMLGGQFAVSHLADTLDLPPVDETDDTFAGNAALKALAVSRALPDELVVADDSGLEVAAIGGAPGVRSARYAGDNATDADNVAKLLTELVRVPEGERSARFCCVLVLAREGRTLASFCGTVEGSIARAAKGAHGFGYDPVFIPTGQTHTFAEMGNDAKSRISHRAVAVRQLRTYIETEYLLTSDPATVRRPPAAQS